MTLATWKGQQPLGYWASTGHDAEAGAGSSAQGVRYNKGEIIKAGDGIPGPIAQTATDRTGTRSGACVWLCVKAGCCRCMLPNTFCMPAHTLKQWRMLAAFPLLPQTHVARAGNLMAEATTNLGIEVVAATGEGARAVAGSGVSQTATERSERPAISGNSRSFRARNVNNPGSHAFTDNGGTSAATTGQGNGPAALAFGAEVASFSRSHRDSMPGGGARDGFP